MSRRGWNPFRLALVEAGRSGTDIAFSASAVEQGDTVSLYYTVAGQDMVRATLHRS